MLFFLLFFILVAFKVHEIVSPEFVFPLLIIVGTAATVIGWLSILILGKRIIRATSRTPLKPQESDEEL